MTAEEKIRKLLRLPKYKVGELVMCVAARGGPKEAVVVLSYEGRNLYCLESQGLEFYAYEKRIMRMPGVE